MRLVLIALVAVLGLVVVLVAALPWLAEPAARVGLRLAALDDVHFERLRFAWGDLELEGITLGPADQELRRLRLVYRLPEVLQGRLERVELEGLVVRAAWRGGRLQLAGIEGAGGAGGPPLIIPEVEEAVLRDARLELTTGLGTLQVPLSAAIRTVGGRLAFEATVDDARLAGPEGTVDANGAIAGELSRAAPLALDQARATGSIAVVAGPAATPTIGGEATARFDLADGRLQIETTVVDGLWQGVTVDEAQIELVVEGSTQATQGTLGVELSDAGFAAPDLTLGGASLGQRLDWRYAAGTLTFHVAEAGALALESLTTPDLRAGPLRLRLEPTDRPLLEVRINEAEPAWRQRASAVIEEAHLTAPAPLQLQSQAGAITLAAEGAGPNLRRAEVGLVGGQLHLPEHALALDGIAAEAELDATGLAPDQTIPITVERISHGGQPAWFAPLALQAELSPGAEGLAFEGTLARIGGGVTLEMRGNRQPSGEGRATVALAPVVFGQHLQPKDLAPIAAGLVSDVSGQLALNGELRWGTAGSTSDLAILVDQLGLTSGPARLEQINGVIRLDALWPPTTPPGQQLAIGLLDLGLPLTAGLTTFQLNAGPRLDVEQLEWRFAGGTARAEPFSLGSRLEGLNVTLGAQQLDLGQLLALTRLEGLSGEGKLDGVLPLRLSDGAVIIEGGELAATGSGVLRYAAGSAPTALQAGGEGVDLLLQALENFHYEALKITLDGRTDAAMDIDLHLAGANPDLYDGHPVEFNLDLEGELANILRQGVASYQIPERIRERMQGFGR